MSFPETFEFDFDTEDIAVRVAFDSDPFDSSPLWTDISADFLSGSTRQGRQHELDRIEAGVATLVVDNASGNYWPDNASGAYYNNLKPGKRINIRKCYAGTWYDVFTGFIESYRPYFPGSSTESLIEITAVDLFKNLARTELNERQADFDGSDNLSVADHADFSMGTSSFSITTWVLLDAIATIQGLIGKTTDINNYEYELTYDTVGARYQFSLSSDGLATSYNFVTAGSPAAAEWHFVVAYYNSTLSEIGLSIDGAAPTTKAYSGGAYDGAATLRLGQVTYSVLGATQRNLDGRLGPTGIWKGRALTNAEIATLYNQGRKTSYASLTSALKTNLSAWWDLDEDSGNRSDSHTGGHTLTDNNTVASISSWVSERSDLRVARVLDEIGWPSGNRDLDTGAATLQALNPVDGTNALSHLQSLQQSENGLVFVQGDGDVEFQNRTARANSPYDTSQATFGEDSGEIGYEDIEISYDDTFIYNDVRLTRTGGTEQIAGDVDSQNTYGKRTLSRTGLLNSTDADVVTVAETLRDAYKDPSQRIQYIIVDPAANPSNLWAKVLSYGISTRITVRLNEASLDSEFHIEGIEHTIGPEGNWKTRWQLSKAS